MAECYDKEDAAFIVEACNSHDANVARIAELEAALRAIAAEEPTDNAAWAAEVARAALAKGAA